MTTGDLRRESKVMLYVLGRLEGLAAKGLVTFACGREPLTPRGRAMYDQLEAEGFRPTADEIARAARLINSPEGP